MQPQSFRMQCTVCQTHYTTQAHRCNEQKQTWLKCETQPHIKHMSNTNTPLGVMCSRLHGTILSQGCLSDSLWQVTACTAKSHTKKKKSISCADTQTEWICTRCFQGWVFCVTGWVIPVSRRCSHWEFGLWPWRLTCCASWLEEDISYFAGHGQSRHSTLTKCENSGKWEKTFGECS